MSNKLATLKTTVDPMVAELVTEQGRVIERDLAAQDKRIENIIQKRMLEIDELKRRIAELEAREKTDISDDKYVLTKTKLLRFMKEMGYID